MGMANETVPPDVAAAAAEREHMTELLAALLVASGEGVRPKNRIAAIRMARACVQPLLDALDNVRLVLAPGAARTEVLAVFVESITRNCSPAAGQVVWTGEHSVEPHLESLIGGNAALLDRLAEERERDAEDAHGIDAEEERKARSEAVQLRHLCSYHEVIFVGRDVAEPALRGHPV